MESSAHAAGGGYAPLDPFGTSIPQAMEKNLRRGANVSGAMHESDDEDFCLSSAVKNTVIPDRDLPDQT